MHRCDDGGGGGGEDRGRRRQDAENKGKLHCNLKKKKKKRLKRCGCPRPTRGGCGCGMTLSARKKAKTPEICRVLCVEEELAEKTVRDTQQVSESYIDTVEAHKEAVCRRSAVSGAGLWKADLRHHRIVH